VTASLVPAGERERALERLEAGTFDCVVIGGGITGAGTARELARRGRSVALLEADDFASGTSGRSSKLIHGGLRYLALGDVALVRETALERKVVHRLAPHLAEPCWMVVPARSRASLLKFRAGLGTYEKLGAVADADRHRVWSGEELARREPSLDRDAHPYACAYREYLTDDARLVLANLRAAAGDGALAVSRVAAERFERSGGDGPIEAVAARCRRTGRELRVRARAVVNAAGPWVEAVRRLEGDDGRSLHLSKGIHVVLERARFPVEHLVILGAADRRSIFAIPRGPVLYVGTTDTSHPAGSERWPAVAREEVDYLLAPLARYFAFARPPAAADVVASWSGLRPLIAQAGKAPKEISRRDEIWEGAGGLVTIAGGKLTGYRPMALSVCERVLARLGAPAPDRSDEGPPLPGGDFAGDLASLAASLPGVEGRVAERLVRLYGGEAAAVCGLGAAPLAGSAVVGGEVAWAIEREGALDLEDFVYRRARIAWFEPGDREALLEPVADAMGDRLGWSDEQREREIAGVRERFAAELDFAG